MLPHLEGLHSPHSCAGGFDRYSTILINQGKAQTGMVTQTRCPLGLCMGHRACDMGSMPLSCFLNPCRHMYMCTRSSLHGFAMLIDATDGLRHATLTLFSLAWPWALPCRCLQHA